MSDDKTTRAIRYDDEDLAQSHALQLLANAMKAKRAWFIAFECKPGDGRGIYMSTPTALDAAELIVSAIKGFAENCGLAPEIALNLIQRCMIARELH